MTPRCDIHVLTHPVYPRDEYLAKCLDSLKDEPADIHCMPGHLRHLGRGRHDGYSSGTNKYVSFVDDDDYIVPGIYQKCIDKLEANPHIDAVTTNEYVISKDGEIKEIKYHCEPSYFAPHQINKIHHVVVCRRKSIEPYLHVLLECPDLADQAIWACMFDDNRVFFNIAEPGYYWRLTNTNSHTLNIQPNQKYMDLINKVFLNRNNLTDKYC